MSKPVEKNISSNTNNSNKKKWLTLGLVGAGLLLIPRRSSRQDTSYPAPSDTDSSLSDQPVSEDVENLHTDINKS
ncbi:hypothetical protein [Psychrobacter frigidicola]|uniref:hypothetical protein n=1 Tax=Psychrobacter frigidicola TaxID=45611 RepID=UPI00191A1790|nr:hypothetical protein [Psychrobacter frigidicola]